MPYKDKETRLAYQRQYQRAWSKSNRQTVAAIKKKYRGGLRDAILSVKRERGCADCGEKHPAVLEFHHPDPSVKTGSLADMVRYFGKDKLAQEVEKCIVLCANCHRKRHWSERH